MAFLSLMMLMVFTSISLAAFYVMIQPALTTSRNEKTQRSGEALKKAVLEFESHFGSIPTATPLAYLVSDVDNTGCTMDTDSASPTFGDLQGWCGPYVDSVWQSEPNAFMLDGWGTLFEVDTSPATAIRSCGPDKLCGGGHAADDLIF